MNINFDMKNVAIMAASAAGSCALIYVGDRTYRYIQKKHLKRRATEIVKETKAEVEKTANEIKEKIEK